MTSLIWESVVKSLDTSGHLHLQMIGLKGFLFLFWLDFQPDGLWLKLKQKKKILPSYAQGVLLFYFVPLLFSRA